MMQPHISRMSSALRALATAGPHYLAATELASPWLNLHGRVSPIQHDGGPQASAGSLGARTMSSSSTPSDQENKPQSSQSDVAAPGAPTQPPRPTFGSRLRDLLAVSSWRISQGDVGRLADVKEDLQAATRPASDATTPEGTAPSAPAPADGVSAAAAASTSQQPAEQLLQAQLLQGLQHEQAQEQGQSSIETTPSSHEDQLQVPQQQQQQKLLHAKYGYAALGGQVPSEEGGAGSSATGLVEMLTAQSPRINPRRRFMPGETYEPQDLNPFAFRATGRTRPGEGAVRRPGAAEVLEKADYKNVAFLSRWFLSPGGRLLSRRQTRLPVHVHKYVSQQIKLARHMGLMAGEARLDKLHLARLREQELLAAQRSAAAAAASSGVGGGSVGDNDAATAGVGVAVSGGLRGRRGGGPRASELAELGA